MLIKEKQIMTGQ